MVAPITLPEIAAMDEVIPELRCMQFAFTQRQQEYGAAAVIASKAWMAYGNAVDDGQPYAEIKRLGDIAVIADELKRKAQGELDAAKATLLATQS